MCSYLPGTQRLLARRLWAPVLASVLLLAGAWAGEETPRDAASYLPAETILCVQIAPWKEWAQAWDQTSAAKLCQEAELRAFLAGPLNRLKELLRGVAPATGEAAPGAGTTSSVCEFCIALSELAPGPVVVALCYSEQDAQAKRPPAAAIIIGSKDPNTIPKAALIAQLSQVALGLIGGETIKQEAYGDTTLVTAKAGNLEPTLCFSKNHVVLTTRADLCKQIVDGLAGTLPRKLADQEAYRECKLTGTEHKSVFLDVAGLRRALGSRGAAAGKVKEILAEAGMDDLRAIAWSLRMNGPAFETRTAILSAGPRKGWLAGLSGEPLSPEAFKLCKPGVPLALAARVQPDRLLPMLEELVRWTGGKEEAERFAAVQKKLAAENRNLAGELAAAFGTELVLTSHKAQGATPAGALTAVLGSLTVKDAAKAEALMVDLMKRLAAERGGNVKAADTVKSLAFEGAKILYLEPPTGFTGLGPTFALSDSRLIVALDMLTLKSAIHGLKEPALSDGSEFQTALKGVGGSLGSLVLYTDYGQLYLAAFNAGATVLKFVGTLLPLRQFGVDLALLPSPEAVTKNLFPALAVVQTTENGLVMISRGPLPSPELLAPPLAALAAVVATFTAGIGAEKPGR